MPAKPKLKPHRRAHIKPKGRFPVWSLVLTIAAGVCWLFFAMYAMSFTQILNAFNAYQSGAEGWEALIEAIFGTIVSEIAMTSLIAIDIVFMLVWGVPALVLTILFIIGWTRKW